VDAIRGALGRAGDAAACEHLARDPRPRDLSGE
jgi:hypothetical protein